MSWNIDQLVDDVLHFMKNQDVWNVGVVIENCCKRKVI